MTPFFVYVFWGKGFRWEGTSFRDAGIMDFTAEETSTLPASEQGVATGLEGPMALHGALTTVAL